MKVLRNFAVDKFSFIVAAFFIKLQLTGILLADVTVDSVFDDNFNNFGCTWYYYDDNNGVGNNDRPNAAPQSIPSIVDVPYIEKARMFRGDTADTHKIKIYRFRIGSEGANRFVTVPFTFGESFRTPEGWRSFPYAGIVTNLALNSKWIDLTGVEKIRFKIRSRKNTLKVYFKVQTWEIDSISSGNAKELKIEDNNPGGYYGINMNVNTGTFQEFEVNIDAAGGGLLPPDWAMDALPFNLKRVTKLAWEISQQENSGTTTDTIDLDDITLVGYHVKPFSPPDFFWRETVSSQQPSIAEFFNNFDLRPCNEFFGYTLHLGSWYAFTDNQIGGTSSILSGATCNAEMNKCDLDIRDGKGLDGKSKGLFLSILSGDSVMRFNSYYEPGFIGIRCNFYDSIRNHYWNAKKEDVDTIYFNYATTGNISSITFEVSDSSNIGKYQEPNYFCRNVYFRKLLPTGGKWAAVKIPFDSLLIPYSPFEGNRPSLRTDMLAKFEWKMNASKDDSGTFSIDNIYFPGRNAYKIDFGPFFDYTYMFACPEDTSIRQDTVNIPTAQHQPKLLQPAFSVLCSNNIIRVTPNFSIVSGIIRVFDCKGKCLESQRIGMHQVAIPSRQLSTGMYIVKINAVGSRGRDIYQITSLPVFK